MTMPKLKASAPATGKNGTKKAVKKDAFTNFAQHTSMAAGSPIAFMLACLIIIIWIVTGPVFKYSDTWQLVINTGTTIITFLMVFLIQNTQNRDSKIIHLKLDELLRAVSGAETDLINMDEMSEKELEDVHKRFSMLAEKAHSELATKAKHHYKKK
ncbi:MAG: low affinity iron permease family protein [Asticcacaulis sp.]